MTKKSEGWLSRRGQAGAATAVELVLERQPQEPVQQIADELIEDSPYQARGPINDAGIAELAQGMQAAGFQGVLIVRPHSDAAKRRAGIFQLVYGHRRRAAWRRVCRERGEDCLLPVVVREVSDAQMLTIGAQENLQRQDLDPVEEAQIVAWAERMFFDKNQAEIGAMLGKSSDWVSTRSRIHKLPEPIKAILRVRPRAITQAIELGTLAQRDVVRAAVLAERVVVENLTLDALRAILRTPSNATAVDTEDRDTERNRRGAATSVSSVTSDESYTATIARGTVNTAGMSASDCDVHPEPLPTPQTQRRGALNKKPLEEADVLAQLEVAAVALTAVVTQLDRLPRTPSAVELLAAAEHALRHIRDTLVSS